MTTSTTDTPATSASEMSFTTAYRASSLSANLTSVTTRISSASAAYAKNNPTDTDTDTAAAASKPVRLVAISKLKPVSDISALQTPPTSQLHFGENYLQELLEKSRILPPEIRWHFIGGLQSNKCVMLARDVRGLWAVESVDTEKKASLLNKGWSERWAIVDEQHAGADAANNDGEVERQLRVFVQVNTSGEESKSGVQPGEPTVTLCRFIRAKCPRLKLQGLMTIGAIARSEASTSEVENEDFLCLRKSRDRVANELAVEGEADQLELSMGMSNDFEEAILHGSNQVRVGSTIFGQRPPKGEPTVR